MPGRPAEPVRLSGAGGSDADPLERYVLQRKQRDGVYRDWANPMTGQVEFASYEHARQVLMRRAPAPVTDFRIVRRVWSFVDLPVNL